MQNVNIIPKRPLQELFKTYLTLGKLPWDRLFLSTSSLLGWSKANIHTSKKNGNTIYSDETKHHLEQFNTTMDRIVYQTRSVGVGLNFPWQVNSALTAGDATYFVKLVK